MLPVIPLRLCYEIKGEQTQTGDNEDPALVADDLRRMGVTVMVVGMGGGVKKSELDRIGRGNAYTAETFQQLVSKEFIGKLTNRTCEVSINPPAPPPPPPSPVTISTVSYGRCKSLSSYECHSFAARHKMTVRTIRNKNRRAFPQGCYLHKRSGRVYFEKMSSTGGMCTSKRLVSISKI